MDDKYSLNNLYDIVVPEQPPLWPLASEVWWLLLMLVVLVAVMVFQWRQAKKRNAYRLAGLALLQGADTVHDVSVILKRVALSAYPREQVASLYGEDWAGFLQQTYKRRNFSIITQSEMNQPADRKMIKLAASWIQHHRAPPSMSS